MEKLGFPETASFRTCRKTKKAGRAGANLPRRGATWLLLYLKSLLEGQAELVVILWEGALHSPCRFPWQGTWPGLGTVERSWKQNQLFLEISTSYSGWRAIAETVLTGGTNQQEGASPLLLFCLPSFVYDPAEKPNIKPTGTEEMWYSLCITKQNIDGAFGAEKHRSL